MRKLIWWLVIVDWWHLLVTPSIKSSSPRQSFLTRTNSLYARSSPSHLIVLCYAQFIGFLTIICFSCCIHCNRRLCICVCQPLFRFIEKIRSWFLVWFCFWAIINLSIIAKRHEKCTPNTHSKVEKSRKGENIRNTHREHRRICICAIISDRSSIRFISIQLSSFLPMHVAAICVSPL